MSVRQQLFQSDNHVALLPAYMVSCMLFRVHSRGFTEVVLLVVGRHGFFANLNLSGEVKGRALGMRLKLAISDQNFIFQIMFQFCYRSVLQGV